MWTRQASRLLTDTGRFGAVTQVSATFSMTHRSGPGPFPGSWLNLSLVHALAVAKPFPAFSVGLLGLSAIVLAWPFGCKKWGRTGRGPDSRARLLPSRGKLGRSLALQTWYVVPIPSRPLT